MTMRNRIESEARAHSRITNQDLVCRDCRSRFDDKIKFGNTTVCEKYPSGKPNLVLLGNACKKYGKEELDEDSV